LRGWVVGLVHVRGGGELGRTWHHAARAEKKHKSVSDLDRCAEWVVQSGIAHPQQLAGEADSAGGFLFASAANRSPHLWAALVLRVGFFDPLTSMLDTSLPLTTQDFHEWGNPLDDEDVFRSLLSLSPYYNLQPTQGYPSVFLTAGMEDYRVPYWQVAKFMARLRQSQHKELSDEHHHHHHHHQPEAILQTRFESGHFGEGR